MVISVQCIEGFVTPPMSWIGRSIQPSHSCRQSSDFVAISMSIRSWGFQSRHWALQWLEVSNLANESYYGWIEGSSHAMLQELSQKYPRELDNCPWPSPTTSLLTSIILIEGDINSQPTPTTHTRWSTRFLIRATSSSQLDAQSSVLHLLPCTQIFSKSLLIPMAPIVQYQQLPDLNNLLKYDPTPIACIVMRLKTMHVSHDKYQLTIDFDISSFSPN